MVLGLRSGMLELHNHDSEWEVNATDTIKKLWNILGSVAKDIQHVGSTSIRNIKAKPIIDIAVAVENFEDVLVLSPALNKNGFIFCDWWGDEEKHLVFQCGEHIPNEYGMRLVTHYSHLN